MRPLADWRPFAFLGTAKAVQTDQSVREGTALSGTARLPRAYSTPQSLASLRSKAAHPDVAMAFQTAAAKANGLRFMVGPEEGVEETARLRNAADRMRALMERPNSHTQNWHQFYAQAYVDYLLGGCYAEIERGADGKPIALWPIPADEISAVTSGDRKAWTWLHTPKSSQFEGRTLAPNDVLAVYRSVPWDASGGVGGYNLKGMSLAVIADVIDALDALDDFNARDFSGDGATARRIVHFEDTPQGPLDLLAEKARQLFEKPDQTLFTGIAGKGTVLQLRDTNTESQMVAYRNDLVRQIYTYAGMNLLDANLTGNSNRSTDAVNRQQSNEGVFKGDVLNFVGALGFIARMFHPQLRVWAPDLDTLDPLAMGDLWMKRLQGGWSIDEVRRGQNLGKAPQDGDTIPALNMALQQAPQAQGGGETPGTAGNGNGTEEVVNGK